MDAVFRDGGDLSRSGDRDRAQLWTGSALAVVVTLFGWAALLKGLSLLLVPPERMAAAYKGLGFERYFYAWMGGVLTLGILITLGAFAS